MDLDPELKAMNDIWGILKPLEEASQKRTLAWVSERLGLTAPHVRKDIKKDGGTEGGNGDAEQTALESFQSASEILGKCAGKTEADKALIVAAYLAKKNGTDELTGQEINKALFHAGHKIKNITRAISTLMNQSPQLMVQTRKSGASQQSRKKYKVTDEGHKQVLRLLQGGEQAEASS